MNYDGFGIQKTLDKRVIKRNNEIYFKIWQNFAIKPSLKFCSYMYIYVNTFEF